MGFVDFLKSRSFFKHLALIILAGALLVWLTVVILNLYTHHGEALELRDFTGYKISDVKDMELEGDFEFVVIDSVYDDHFPKGAIVLQDPIPGSRVKRGRKVYVTTVAIQPEMVEMPDLKNLSLRQALMELRASGLKLDKLTYIRNFARNAVLEQVFGGDTILPGTDILKGSSVELVMGKGLDEKKTDVPFLIGKNESEAISMINNAGLNVGYLKYLDGRDKLHSRVYEQQPPALSEEKVEFGAYVDIWMRSDETFNFDSLVNVFREKALEPDTLGINEDLMNEDR